MNQTTHYSIAIAKEELAKMPLVSFPGQISVISTPEQAQEAVCELMKHSCVGFDTETKPSFRKGKMNDVALLQVSTEDHAFLFRLNLIGIEPVRPLLESEQILKIGLSLKDDFQMLARRGEVDPLGFIDLQKFVKTFAIADSSLQKIYGIIFGQRISKAQRLSNWEAPALTHGQQVYAAIDAWACLRVYHHLLDGGFDPEACAYKVYEETPAEREETPAVKSEPSAESTPQPRKAHRRASSRRRKPQRGNGAGADTDPGNTPAE